MLAASSQPLFAHSGADLLGTREIVLLAELTGAVVDHVASESLLRDLDSLRETGGFATTPMETRVRADVVLLLGKIESETELSWLNNSAIVRDKAAERRLVTVGDNATEHELLTAIAILRWLIRQPSFAAGFSDLAEAAEILRNAKFGVAIWHAARLPALAVEAVQGLVRDLNETTRFSTLPLPAPDNGAGVQTICGWMTGFPLRTGFARGWPEHDPWRYDARRMIAADETDCIIWISSLQGGATPPNKVNILLDDGYCSVDCKPRIRIPVSAPGPGDVLFDWRMGTLSPLRSGFTGAAPTVAATLAQIRAKLEVAC
jgi:formylmethanofuran dehydrogenase subunit B